MRIRSSAVWRIVLLVVPLIGYGQQRQQNPVQTVKPVSLVFREDFLHIDRTVHEYVPLTAAAAANPNLELKLYGPGAKGRNDETGLELVDAADPVTGHDVDYLWSGVTEGSWAVMLKDKNGYLDLTGAAKIRWRVRMRGFNALRPVVKLVDGTILAGDFSEPASTYWREDEIYFVDIPRWRVLDEAQIVGSTDSAWRTNVDLSKVDEIGFTDLARGAGRGTGGSSGVDWMEVYGGSVRRDAFAVKSSAAPR